MTEEEKRIKAEKIEADAAKLKGLHPDMPSELAKLIADWNYDRVINVISANHLEYVEKIVHKRRKDEVNYDNLLSEDKELAYGTMVSIIGRDLAEEISKTPEIEKYFAKYIYFTVE